MSASLLVAHSAWLYINDVMDTLKTIASTIVVIIAGCGAICLFMLIYETAKNGLKAINRSK